MVVDWVLKIGTLARCFGFMNVWALMDGHWSEL